jgi:hypothetical protein
LEEEARQAKFQIRKEEAEFKSKKLEMKRRELDFNSSLQKTVDGINNAAADAYVTAADRESSITKEDNLHWMQIILGNKDVEAVEWVHFIRGDEFACVHNRDSKDFMNVSKFEHFILKSQEN